MKGSRKLKIALTALAVFLTISVLGVLFDYKVEYFMLGTGIAAMLATVMYGYYKEYQFKKTDNDNGE